MYRLIQTSRNMKINEDCPSLIQLDADGTLKWSSSQNQCKEIMTVAKEEKWLNWQQPWILNTKKFHWWITRSTLNIHMGWKKKVGPNDNESLTCRKTLVLQVTENFIQREEWYLSRNSFNLKFCSFISALAAHQRSYLPNKFLYIQTVLKI